MSQWTALALFLYLFLQAVDPPPVGGLPVDLFMRLDPLLGLGAAIAAREITHSLLWTVPLVLVALLAGRVFCGWLCPLGTVLDLASPRSSTPESRPAASLRSLRYVLLAVVLGSTLVASAALLALDPLSLLTRTLALVLYPLFNLTVTAVQTTAYHGGIVPDFWVWLDGAWRGSVLPYFQPYFRLAALFLGLFALVLLANLLAPRFWCRYLCPLGAFFGLLGRWAPLRRRLGAECNNCGMCAGQCAVGAIDPRSNIASADECVLCLGCGEACPAGAINYLPPGEVVHYNPTRRRFLLGLGGGIVALGSLRVGTSAALPDPWLVRPPGAGDDFLSRCMRCGKCMKACPTAGLQPATLEAGLEGLWSPVLVSRLGFCDFSCTTCGQVCPTGAIRPLDLEEKRQAVIGVAYLDEKRCLPFADGQTCIICEEMCPVPDKAIVLREERAITADGSFVDVQLPYVLRDKCIGCGICEYYCPLPNEAAIRVYATGSLAERERR